MDLKSRINGKLRERLQAYFNYKNDFDKNSLEYIFLKRGLYHFFTGAKLAHRITYDKLLDFIESNCWDAENNRFVFGDIILPYGLDETLKMALCIEFIDLIMPYYSKNKKILEFIYREGPYEENENVCLHKGDIVIDAGANIGLFSAVASLKGCKVYSFEPMAFVIDNYLSKIASFYENIEICNYALSDKDTTLKFELHKDNIGMSHACTSNDDKNNDTITVQATSIDNFVNKNNLKTVDFIKADIEGAERHMLKGAKNVLKDFAPRLSICTYHLPDDPAVLKELILDANPNYIIKEKYLKLYAHVPAL